MSAERPDPQIPRHVQKELMILKKKNKRLTAELEQAREANEGLREANEDLHERLDGVEIDLELELQAKKSIILDIANLKAERKILRRRAKEQKELTQALTRIQDFLAGTNDFVKNQKLGSEELSSMADSLKTLPDQASKKAVSMIEPAISPDSSMIAQYEEAAQRVPSLSRPFLSLQVESLQQAKNETESDIAQSRISTPAKQKPAKSFSSSMELEMLRLKDRETLHRLRP